MFNIGVSCPGKVILHGEHSVVYKKPALAAAIGIRTRAFLKINEIQKINLKYTNIDLDFIILLEDYHQFYKEISIEKVVDEEEILKRVKSFIENYTKNDNLSFQKINAIISTFYLLTTISIENKLNDFTHGFDIELSSDIKIGAGLGSSASFGVCLAACFLKLMNFLCGTEESTVDIHLESSRYAFLSEKVMHGKPSGVDNTVCSFGNIIKFTPLKGTEVINLKEKLPMLLIDTKVSRSTAKLVQHVSELKNHLPNVMDHILSAMGEIVESAVPVYETYTSGDENKFKDIERFIRINNNLLRACEVSHKSLEEIFTIALNYDFSCKLTGAGGGGFALIVLPPNYNTQERFELLCKDLKEKGYDYIETVMGDDGIKFESSV